MSRTFPDLFVFRPRLSCLRFLYKLHLKITECISRPDSLSSCELKIRKISISVYVVAAENFLKQRDITPSFPVHTL